MVTSYQNTYVCANEETVTKYKVKILDGGTQMKFGQTWIGGSYERKKYSSFSTEVRVKINCSEINTPIY